MVCVAAAAIALEPHLRQQIEIVTKCGITRDGDQAMYDTSTAHILESAERSLRALQTPFIDLLLIHRPDPLLNAEEVAEAFRQLKSSGKVRFFGASLSFHFIFSVLPSPVHFLAVWFPFALT
eukprot:SAG31_NODE_15245_length_764_cov_0.691729_2_plen_121_part_01